jgi:peptidoglycan/xylan/chitin deacetylase (PgdA/CDA1 family)
VLLHEQFTWKSAVGTVLLTADTLFLVLCVEKGWCISLEFQLCYPNWAGKALTFSYDDGQVYDRRLVELFNAYDLKATFHLNSGRLDTPGFVTTAELPALYAGHEVACHGVRHAYPTHLAQTQLVEEYWQDRLALEGATGHLVRGCSYAYGQYDQRVISTLQTLDFAYSRTVEATHDFRVPERLLTWNPTCHHNDAFDGALVERFLNEPKYSRLNLFYIWGHSFELERDQTWDKMEALCASLSNAPGVWYTTNIDYAAYLSAARQLIFRADGSQVKNPSAVRIYALMDGHPVVL